MKPVLLLLPFLAMAACTGTEPSACKGEVFQLNPTRMVQPVPFAAAPGVTPVASVLR